MASTIKVDNVQNQPGTNIINKCGTTVTVGACGNTVNVCGASVVATGNVVKSNALQASDAGNIISQSGTDITLGASGDTINLASGASQTGFGRTGTVDWDTSIHTGTVTAATGKGYFVNTTAGAITVNLPAASVGSIVAVSDYASTADSNNITVTPNGSDKINAVNDDYVISTKGLAVTLVYADATRGWKSVTGSDADSTGVAALFIIATGGSPCTGAICGDYKTHTFTGPGTFCVSQIGSGGGSTAVDYMIVAGGAGGGGKNNGGGVGGGGAGGVRVGTVCASPTIPISAPGYTVSATGYPIVIGAGGGCSVNMPSGTAGYVGVASSGFSLTAAGGGGGNDAYDNGAAGGSGGGGGEAGGCGGAGDTPSVSPPQGKPGGNGNSPSVGGGGGGALCAGESSTPSASSPTGDGGDGVDGGAVFGTGSGSPGGFFAGGGGTSTGCPSAGPFQGGAGGGGDGNSHDQASQNGGVNTGGGGGAHGVTGSPQGGTNAGGSGIVIIRYKFQ